MTTLAKGEVARTAATIRVMVGLLLLLLAACSSESRWPDWDAGVADTSEPCRGSEMCSDFGQCTGNRPNCRASNKEDCLQSKICKQGLGSSYHCCYVGGTTCYPCL
jgi:hypothetical protein